MLNKQRVSRLVTVGAAAALLAPVVLTCAVVGLTIHERAELEAAGWSPIHRTAVEWPSVLALGPAGWVEAVAFIICGFLGLLFAASFAFAHSGWSAGRLSAWAVAVLSLAVALEALRADRSASSSTWHGQLHNDVYPFIPLALLLATLATSRNKQASRVLQVTSLAAAVAVAVAVAVTLFAPVAEVGRYVLLAIAVGWLELVAWSFRARSRRRGGRYASVTKSSNGASG